MSVPIKRLVVSVWLALVVAVGVATTGRSNTARAAASIPSLPPLTAAGSARTPNAVQRVAAGQRLGAAPGQKGATYYALEAQTARLTTAFIDGTIARSERAIDGTVTGKLFDRDGNELHRLRIDHIDESARVLSFAATGGSPTLAAIDKAVHTTLDWTNHQHHTLHLDGVSDATTLEWRNGLMRRSGAQRRDEADDDRATQRIETVWANGLSATTTRVHAKSGDRFAGRALEGEVLATKIVRDGVQIGLANYFVLQRIYAWRIDGVADGWIAGEHLQLRYGGWPFTPDMIWMNLQTLALYQWKSAINRTGFVARDGACPGAAPRLARRVANFLVPTVYANDPGCDGLHWLDGTVLRYCCDVHDYCYSKAGCTATSWWQWWSSWQCDACNAFAVWCFASGGGTHILYPCAC